LAAGLFGLLTGRVTSTGGSSTASSFSSSSFSSSSSSSSDSTSPYQGVGIVGVTTAGGEVAFLFLFFFSAAFTANPATATAELVASPPPT
jgi:hypothetical protein